MPDHLFQVLARQAGKRGKGKQRGDAPRLKRRKTRLALSDDDDDDDEEEDEEDDDEEEDSENGKADKEARSAEQEALDKMLHSAEGRVRKAVRRQPPFSCHCVASFIINLLTTGFASRLPAAEAAQDPRGAAAQDVRQGAKAGG